MNEERTTYYKALVTHDRRFDGRFFVGVKTTGIYCRPICKVRTPKEQNCLFFKTAAMAEWSGFRPCLKCRPELAPGVAGIDSESRLAGVAAGLIDADFLHDATLTALAAQLHITDRHLRRVFQANMGVSPVAYAQTHKLLLAKQLLTETSLSVVAIAYSSGFGSLSRFNSLFKTKYRMSPSQLRKRPLTNEQTLDLSIGYRPPFAWDDLLAFLARRAIAGVEVVENNAYMRTVAVVRGGKAYEGWIQVSNDVSTCQLHVRMPIELTSVCAVIIERVKQLFDTDCQPDIVAAHLGELAAEEPGLRVPGAFDGFEVSVRAVLGQQISVKAATAIAGRMAGALGKTIKTPHAGLTTIFPNPDALSRVPLQELIACGLYSKRAETIQHLAQACKGGLQLIPQADVEDITNQLQQIPGIGDWTAQYIAMRALAWPDAFPSTDYAVKKALGEQNPAKILERAKPWQPWRAYATLHIWHSLHKKENE